MTQWDFDKALSKIRWRSNPNNFKGEILIDNPIGNFKRAGFYQLKVMQTITRPPYL